MIKILIHTTYVLDENVKTMSTSHKILVMCLFVAVYIL